MDTTKWSVPHNSIEHHHTTAWSMPTQYGSMPTQQHGASHTTA